MSLAEASEARKARLIALRRRKDGEQVDEPIISHRNFDPTSRTLRKRDVQDADMNVDTVENNVEGLAEKIIKEDEARRAQELNVFNIAPKRANWDLKRELEKKLAKLDRKTQEAIHTLIRQRLAAQKGDNTDDLVGAMRTQADDAGNDSDDE
ncbi:mRNA splicing factor [Flagelloscypha sp. PMI_526]|nr:mRNA splicing factor [Flagelloscypha sp. PMI_526]